MITLNNIDEKLTHFNEIILKEASAQRNRILEEIKADEENLLTARRKEFEEKAAELLRKETYAAEREKNNLISHALSDGKLQLMKMRETIIESVYSELRLKLLDFVSSEDYAVYLADNIKEACEKAGTGRLIINVCSRDIDRHADMLAQLRQRYGFSIESMGDDQIGGCRILNQEGNIFIDNSLKKRMEMTYDDFLEICGLRIE